MIIERSCLPTAPAIIDFGTVQYRISGLSPGVIPQYLRSYSDKIVLDASPVAKQLQATWHASTVVLTLPLSINSLKCSALTWC